MLGKLGAALRKLKPSEPAPQSAWEAHLAASDLSLRTDLSPAPMFRTFKDMRSTRIVDRYREYLFKARSHGMAEVEQLVPYIEVPMGPSRAEAQSQTRDDAAAQALLAEFPPPSWGYYLPLSQNYATLGEKDALPEHFKLSRRRSEYRLNFIYRGLEAVLGQAPGAGLGGRSMLDIACNWGGFSVEAALRGAGDITGFDIRDQNIDKARRVAAHFGVADQINFATQDLFTYEAPAPYDIVLNLGLMYHISQPFEMMQKTYEMTGEIAVIDTIVHREAFSGFILQTGGAAVDHAATAIGVELHPTYRALIDLAYMVGFREVIELRGIPDPAWTGFAEDHYGNGSRRCIIGIK